MPILLFIQAMLIGPAKRSFRASRYTRFPGDVPALVRPWDGRKLPSRFVVTYDFRLEG